MGYFVIGIAALALLLTLSASSAGDSVATLLVDLNKSQPDWFPDLSTCPAALIPRQQVQMTYLGDRCMVNAQQCLDLCESADANACYALALAVQSVDEGPLSEALFLRSCSLGAVSGCTNRAAAIIKDDPECSIRTFELACALQDPWGCTMLGSFLSLGFGMDRDTDRALEVLRGSCRLGEVDEACRYAKSIIARIRNAEEERGAPHE